LAQNEEQLGYGELNTSLEQEILGKNKKDGLVSFSSASTKSE